jgi:predicted TIM-barrel fold metal-dependent hydrolase
MTRRDAVRVTAAAVVGGSLMSRSSSAAVAGVRPSLRERVAGRTVNVHCHLPDSSWLKEPPPRMPTEMITEESVAAYARRLGVEVPPDALAEARERAVRYNEAETIRDHAALFIDEMDAAGIDVAVLQMIDHSFQPGDFGRQFKVPYEQVLEEAAEAIASYPGRFLMFAGVDPSRGKAGVPLFERAVVEYGCVGLGEWVTQQWEVFPSDRELCYPYFEKCLDLGVPYSNNCEGRFEHCAPGVFAQIAEDFPDLRIELSGSGRPRPSEERNGTARWAFPHEALLLADRYPNVYIDMDDWQRIDREGITYYLTYLRRALSSDARRRVMFGSDHPVTYLMYSERGWIDITVERAAEYGVLFDDEDLELYFSANALEFLGPAAAGKLGLNEQGGAT